MKILKDIAFQIFDIYKSVKFISGEQMIQSKDFFNMKNNN